MENFNNNVKQKISNLKNLNKDQIINIVLMALAAIVFVVLVVYFYKDITKDKTEVEEENMEVPVSTENTTIPPTIESTTTPNTPATPTTPAPTTTSAENKAKFSTAMANASKAFNKGEYPKAIDYYNEALKYMKTDTAYSGLFNTYGAQGDWVKAKTALDAAITINPLFTDYWTSKLTMMDEKTDATFASLKKVYTEGLTKVDGKTKINLVTHFARIAEANGEDNEAVALFTYAKQVHPANASVYDQEISRINGLK